MPQKTYEYAAVVIGDRGHLDDPEFLAMLCEMGAQGYKRVEEQPKGSNKLVVLLERETSHAPAQPALRAISLSGMTEGEVKVLAKAIAEEIREVPVA